MHGTHYLDIIFCNGVKNSPKCHRLDRNLYSNNPQSDSISPHTNVSIFTLSKSLHQSVMNPIFLKKCLHLSTPKMTSIFHVEILYHSRDIILLYYVDTLYHNSIPPTQHFHPWYNFIKIKTRYLKHTLRSRTDPGNLSSDLD